MPDRLGLGFCAALGLLVGCGRTDPFFEEVPTSSGAETFDVGDGSAEVSGAEAEVAGAEAEAEVETGVLDTDTTGTPCEAAYGDPGAEGESCCDEEVPLWLNGVEGGFCAPTCVVDEDCPASPAGEPVLPMCLYPGPSGEKEYCALACQTATSPDACPEGSSCKATTSTGWGICTWP